MNDVNLEKQLQQQLAQLPTGLEPSRDLWAGIDHAIEMQQQRRRPRGIYQRLSAVAAGVGLTGLTVWLSLTVNVIPSDEGSNWQHVTLMSELFEQQKQTLLVKYADRQASADNWRSQLAELDDAAEAIKKVLDEDPANAQLLKMLQQVYQQQLDLIHAVNKNPWQQI